MENKETTFNQKDTDVIYRALKIAYTKTRMQYVHNKDNDKVHPIKLAAWRKEIGEYMDVLEKIDPEWSEPI